MVSWAVCSVRLMGLAMMATSAGSNDGESKRSFKLWRSVTHCSTPVSESRGSGMLYLCAADVRIVVYMILAWSQLIVNVVKGLGVANEHNLRRHRINSK
jgi:hypothetical protein